MSDIYNPSRAPSARVTCKAHDLQIQEPTTLRRRIGWFDIYVEDMERATAFYEAVLATTLAPMDDPNDPTTQMPGFGDDFTSHGAGGALVKLEHAQPGPGGSMVYFSCVDGAVEEARVASAGGTVVRPRFSIGDHGFVSIVTDTEGNVIGLHSSAQPQELKHAPTEHVVQDEDGCSYDGKGCENDERLIDDDGSSRPVHSL